VVLICEARPQLGGDVPASLSVRVCPPVTRGNAGQSCEQFRLLLRDATPMPVICDVDAITSPDLVTVDLLARMQLTARRLGFSLRIRGASDQLLQLLELTGLGDCLPPYQDP
jgi:hypothetical protein